MNVFVMSIIVILMFTLFIIAERIRLRQATKEEIVAALISHSIMIVVFTAINGFVVNIAKYLFQAAESSLDSVYWHVPLVVALFTTVSYCGWYFLNYYVVKPSDDNKKKLLLIIYSFISATVIFLYLRSHGVDTLVSRDSAILNIPMNAWNEKDDLLLAYMAFVAVLALATFYMFSKQIQSVITIPGSAIALATILFFSFSESTGLNLITFSKYDPSLEDRFWSVVIVAALFSTIWWKSKKWQSSFIVKTAKFFGVLVIIYSSLTMLANVMGMNSGYKEAIHSENRNNVYNYYTKLKEIKEKKINGYTSKEVTKMTQNLGKSFGDNPKEKQDSEIKIYTEEERALMIESEKEREKMISDLSHNQPAIRYYVQSDNIQALIVKVLRLFPAGAEWVKETGYTAFPGAFDRNNYVEKTGKKNGLKVIYQKTFTEDMGDEYGRIVVFKYHEDVKDFRNSDLIKIQTYVPQNAPGIKIERRGEWVPIPKNDFMKIWHSEDEYIPSGAFEVVYMPKGYDMKVKVVVTRKV